MEDLWCECGLNILKPKPIIFTPNPKKYDDLLDAIREYGTKGEIKLPKEDKYEEFKEWFRNQTDISWRATGCHFVDYDDELPFSKFEHEWCEKEKEKRIKNVIDYALGKQGCCNPNKFVDKIYDELNEKGLLK